MKNLLAILALALPLAAQNVIIEVPDGGSISATGTGQVISTSGPAGTLTGTALAPNVVTSSLTGAAGGSFGSLAYLSAAPAGTLTGTTLASNVVNSSLETVGTITSGDWHGSVIASQYGGTNATTPLDARINLAVRPQFYNSLPNFMSKAFGGFRYAHSYSGATASIANVLIIGDSVGADFMPQMAVPLFSAYGWGGYIGGGAQGSFEISESGTSSSTDYSLWINGGITTIASGGYFEWHESQGFLTLMGNLTNAGFIGSSATVVYLPSTGTFKLQASAYTSYGDAAYSSPTWIDISGTIDASVVSDATTLTSSLGGTGRYRVRALALSGNPKIAGNTHGIIATNGVRINSALGVGGSVLINYANTPGAAWTNLLAAFPPDLVFINFKDRADGGDATYNPASLTVAQALANTIARIKTANPLADIVLVGAYRSLLDDTSPGGDSVADFTALLKTCATDVSDGMHKVFWDEQPIWNTWSNGAVLGFYGSQSSPFTISGATAVGTTATVTTSAPHGLATGNGVAVVGVANNAYNGGFVVASVPTSTSFTYTALAAPSGSSSGGTATKMDSAHGSEIGRSVLAQRFATDFQLFAGPASGLPFQMPVNYLQLSGGALTGAVTTTSKLTSTDTTAISGNNYAGGVATFRTTGSLWTKEGIRTDKGFYYGLNGNPDYNQVLAFDDAGTHAASKTTSGMTLTYTASNSSPLNVSGQVSTRTLNLVNNGSGGLTSFTSTPDAVALVLSGSGSGGINGEMGRRTSVRHTGTYAAGQMVGHDYTVGFESTGGATLANIFRLHAYKLSSGTAATWAIIDMIDDLTALDANAYLIRGSGRISLKGNIETSVAGYGFKIKEGPNARMGTATLSSGTVTVSNTTVTAVTRFQVTRVGKNSSTAIGGFNVSATPGTSFVIDALKLDTTLETGDASTVNWFLTEPSP
jgi:hypothetical protein